MSRNGLPLSALSPDSCRQRMSHGKLQGTRLDSDSQRTQILDRTTNGPTLYNDHPSELDSLPNSQEKLQHVKDSMMCRPLQQHPPKQVIKPQGTGLCGNSLQRALLGAQRWFGQWGKQWAPAILAAKKVKTQ